MLIEFAIFAAAAFAVFFSFAVAAAAAAAVAAAKEVHAVAKVRAAVAFVGSPFLLVGVVVVGVVVVVGGKAVHRSFFEECDLLVGGRTRFRQVRSMDLTFVVWLRTMLHYYSL